MKDQSAQYTSLWISSDSSFGESLGNSQRFFGGTRKTNLVLPGTVPAIGDRTKTYRNHPWESVPASEKLIGFLARQCGERRGVANVEKSIRGLRCMIFLTKNHPAGRRLLQTEPKKPSCFWGWASSIRRTFRRLWSMRLSIPTSRFGQSFDLTFCKMIATERNVQSLMNLFLKSMSQVYPERPYKL